MSVSEANKFPGLARVYRFVNTISADNIPPNAGFSGSDIDHVGIGFRDRNRSDRWGGIFLLVEDWLPVESAIGALPNSARCRTEVISVCLSDHTRDRHNATTAKRTNQAILQAPPWTLRLFVIILVGFRFGRCRGGFLARGIRLRFSGSCRIRLIFLIRSKSGEADDKQQDGGISHVTYPPRVGRG